MADAAAAAVVVVDAVVGTSARIEMATRSAAAAWMAAAAVTVDGAACRASIAVAGQQDAAAGLACAVATDDADAADRLSSAIGASAAAADVGAWDVACRPRRRRRRWRALEGSWFRLDWADGVGEGGWDRRRDDRLWTIGGDTN